MKSIIKGIASKLGYIKLSELTESQLATYFNEIVGTGSDSEFPKEAEESLYKNLRNVEDFRDYLKSMASKDIMRFFAAKGEKEQDIIRGSFARTVYILSRLRNQPAEGDKLNNKRYAK